MQDNVFDNLDQNSLDLLNKLYPSLPPLKRSANALAAPPKPPKKQGLLSDIGDAFSFGVGNADRALSAAANYHLGDLPAVEKLAQEHALAQQNKPQTLKDFDARLAQEDAYQPGFLTRQVEKVSPGAAQLMEAAGDYVGAAWDQPRGFAMESVSQLANMAAPMVGNIAGGIAGGAAAGALTANPIGVGAGAIVGGALGALPGNYGLEAGNYLLDAARDGLTQEEADNQALAGLKKGAVISGVDGLFLGAGHGLSRFFNRGAIEAGARAEAKVLRDAVPYLDMTDRNVVNAVLRELPDLAKTAEQAGRDAAKAATSMKQRVGMGAGAIGGEMFGEGAGEGLGEYAATGQFNPQDIVREAFSGAGISAVEAAAAMRESRGNNLNASGIARAANALGAAPDAQVTPTSQTTGVVQDKQGGVTPIDATAGPIQKAIVEGAEGVNALQTQAAVTTAIEQQQEKPNEKTTNADAIPGDAALNAAAPNAANAFEQAVQAQTDGQEIQGQEAGQVAPPPVNNWSRLGDETPQQQVVRLRETSQSLGYLLDREPDANGNVKPATFASEADANNAMTAFKMRESDGWQRTQNPDGTYSVRYNPKKPDAPADEAGTPAEGPQGPQPGSPHGAAPLALPGVPPQGKLPAPEPQGATPAPVEDISTDQKKLDIINSRLAKETDPAKRAVLEQVRDLLIQRINPPAPTQQPEPLADLHKKQLTNLLNNNRSVDALLARIPEQQRAAAQQFVAQLTGPKSNGMQEQGQAPTETVATPDTPVQTPQANLQSAETPQAAPQFEDAEGNPLWQRDGKYYDVDGVEVEDDGYIKPITAQPEIASDALNAIRNFGNKPKNPLSESEQQEYDRLFEEGKRAALNNEDPTGSRKKGWNEGYLAGLKARQDAVEQDYADHQAKQDAKRKKQFTYAVKPVDGGFVIESDDGGGIIMSGRPNGPGILNTVPPKVFSTEAQARAYMQKKKLQAAADTATPTTDSAQDKGKAPTEQVTPDTPAKAERELTDLSDEEYKDITSKAKYLSDVIYSAAEFFGDDKKAHSRFVMNFSGKGIRDRHLQEAFGLSMHAAHTINNGLDSSGVHKLRRVDMEEALSIFPSLSKHIEEASRKAPTETPYILGKTAFKAGQQRILPDEYAEWPETAKDKWYRGWDLANAETKPLNNSSRDQEKAPAYNAGKAAFAAGQQRMLPDEYAGRTTAEKREWYRGWDMANLAAPVESATPESVQDKGKAPTKTDEDDFARAASQDQAEVVHKHVTKIFLMAKRFESSYGRGQWRGYTKKLIATDDYLKVFVSGPVVGDMAKIKIALAKAESSQDLAKIITKLESMIAAAESADTSVSASTETDEFTDRLSAEREEETRRLAGIDEASDRAYDFYKVDNGRKFIQRIREWIEGGPLAIRVHGLTKDNKPITGNAASKPLTKAQLAHADRIASRLGRPVVIYSMVDANGVSIARIAVEAFSEKSVTHPASFDASVLDSYLRGREGVTLAEEYVGHPKTKQRNSAPTDTTTPDTPVAPPKTTTQAPQESLSSVEATQGEPAPKSNFGATNKVFTKDLADAARERLRKKFAPGRLNSGIDPEILLDGILLGGYYVEAGARKFADFSKAMLADLGETAKPYLRSWYEGIRHYPGIDASGMSTPEEIERATLELENPASQGASNAKNGSITKYRLAGSDTIYYRAVFYDTDEKGATKNGTTQEQNFSSESAARKFLEQNGVVDAPIYQSVQTGNTYADNGSSSELKIAQSENGTITVERPNDSRKGKFGSVDLLSQYLDRNYFDWPENRSRILSQLDQAKSNYTLFSFDALKAEMAKRGLKYRVGMTTDDLISALSSSKQESTKPPTPAPDTPAPQTDETKADLTLANQQAATNGPFSTIEQAIDEYVSDTIAGWKAASITLYGTDAPVKADVLGGYAVVSVPKDNAGEYEPGWAIFGAETGKSAANARFKTKNDAKTMVARFRKLAQNLDDYYHADGKLKEKPPAAFVRLVAELRTYGKVSGYIHSDIDIPESYRNAVRDDAYFRYAENYDGALYDEAQQHLEQGGVLPIPQNNSDSEDYKVFYRRAVTNFLSSEAAHTAPKRELRGRFGPAQYGWGEAKPLPAKLNAPKVATTGEGIVDALARITATEADPRNYLRHVAFTHGKEATTAYASNGYMAIRVTDLSNAQIPEALKTYSAPAGKDGLLVMVSPEGYTADRNFNRDHRYPEGVAKLFELDSATTLASSSVDTHALREAVTGHLKAAAHVSQDITNAESKRRGLPIHYNTPTVSFAKGGESIPVVFHAEFIKEILDAFAELGSKTVDITITEKDKTEFRDSQRGLSAVIFPLTGEDKGLFAPISLNAPGKKAQRKPTVGKAADKKPVKAATKDDPNTLTDFGEKLGGARKDRYAEMREAFSRELSDQEIASQPLSKTWPKDSIEAIDDTFIAAFAHTARSSLPAKPKNARKMQRWVDKLKVLRSFVQNLVDDSAYKAIVIERLKELNALEGFKAKINLLEQLDRSQWDRIGSVEEYPDAYRFSGGKEIPAPFVSVAIDNKVQSYKASSIEEALDDIKATLDSSTKREKRMAFEIRGRGDSYFINKKGDSLYRRLKTFTSLDAARTFLSDNHDELVAAWDAVKESDNVKEADVRGKTNRPRAAQDWRKGKDVTPEQFSDEFGFRGVEFGNWVAQGKNSKDRQGMLNAAYDAFMDLSSILNIPPKAMSLNGSLGLGFGSRGSGKFSAHYEPGNIVINLTKTRGAGSLAHEWFHAVDNYFSRMRGEGDYKATIGGDQREDMYITHKPEPLMVHKKSPATRMTKERLATLREANPSSGFFAPENWQRDPAHPQGVRPEVEKTFADLVAALNASPMAKRAMLIDTGKSDGYWSRTLELAARSFENYIIHKMAQNGYHNDYLANVQDVKDFSRDIGRYPYLLEEELAPVAEAFDALFNTIETRKTENGVEMYSRAGQRLRSGITKQQVESWVAPLVKRFNALRFPVQVVQSVSDLEQYKAVFPDLALYPDMRGVVLPDGQAFLVADNVYSKEGALRTLRHEIIGHRGVNALLNENQWKALVDRIARLESENDPRLMQVLATIRRNYRDANGAYTLDPIGEAAEVLAHYAEQETAPTWMQRFIALIKKALAKVGLYNLDNAEIANILSNAAKLTQTRGSGFTLMGDGSVEAYHAMGVITAAEDKAYLDALNNGDMEKAHQMVLDAAMRAGVPIINEEGVTAYRVRRTSPPKKTVKAYKLFRVKKSAQGDVFPLFVGANDPIPQDIWLDAIAGPEANPSKTGKRKVKSKLGDLAYRPGWHAGDIPLATHIGAKQTKSSPIIGRKEDEVWAEVEVAADRDYQPEATQNGTKENGEFSHALADIKHMPDDGFYRYKTNPNMTGQWIISGSMKITRVLTENEVNDILRKADMDVMPWTVKTKDKSNPYVVAPLNLARFGITTNPAKNQKKLLDTVTYDDNGKIIPLSLRFDRTKTDPRYARTRLINMRDGESPLGYFYRSVAAFDEAYQKPVSGLKDLEGLLTHYLGSRGKVLSKTQENNLDGTKRYNVTTFETYPTDKNGNINKDDKRTFDVLVDTKNKTVHIDVSRLKEGRFAGSAIYAAVGEYAHNNDLVFQGDPVGLRDVAVFRRLENMISSALKFNTTKHLTPHPKQMQELAKFGLRWKKGDEAGNLESMLHASWNYLLNTNPDLANYGYDFERDVFSDTRTGRVLAEQDFESLAESTRQRGASVGRATLQRGFLTQSLLRESGAAGRDRLLVEALQLLAKPELNPSLKRIFYSRAGAADAINYVVFDPQDVPVLETFYSRGGLPDTIDVDGVQRPTMNSNGKPIHPTEEGIRNFWRWFGASKVVDEQGRPLVVYHATGSYFDTFSVTSDIGYHFGTKQAARDRGKNIVPSDVEVEESTVRQQDRDLLAAMRGELGDTLVDKVYGLLLRKLEHPKRDLRQTLTKMSPPELEATQAEYANEPDARNLNDRITATENTARFSVRVGGETIAAFANRNDAIAKAAEVRRRIATPMALYLRMDKGPTVTDLGVWPAQEIASELGFTAAEQRRVAAADGQDAQYEIVRKIAAEKGIDGFRYINKVEDKGSQSFTVFSPNQIKSAIGNTGAFSPADNRIHYSRAGAAEALVNAPGKWRDFKDYLSNKSADWRPAWIKGLTRQQITELGKDQFGGVIGRYERVAREMEAYMGEYLTDPIAEGRKSVSEIADAWANLLSRFGKDAGKNRATGAKLAKLMHESTLAGIDPSKSFNRQWTVTGPGAESSKKHYDDLETYTALRKQWDALPENAQALYKDVRDAYARQHRGLLRAVIERIEAAEDAIPGQKTALIARIRAIYEQQKLNGVYFPLSRFGDYFVRYTAPDGTVGVQQFETQAEQRQTMRELQANHYTIDKFGKRIQDLYSDPGMTPKALTDVFGLLEAQDNLDPELRDEMRDGLYQLYLQSLPELSVRKHFRHRQGTPGFSQDALRAFTSQLGHGARNISRTKYGYQLADVLRAMREQTKTAPDPNKAADIVKALDANYKWMMNPQNAKWSQNLTSLGFTWYLGASLAAGLVNFSQVPIVALPELAVRYGSAAKASAELAKATADYTKTVVGTEASKKANRTRLNAEFDGDMGKMLKRLESSGAVDRTQVMSILGLGDSSDALRQGRGIMAKIGWIFHQTERANRELTAIATYRLAREKGDSHETAERAAYDVVFASHFDYSSSNRAEFMRGNMARVLFLFKQYSQNMAWLLGRNFHQALKGESPQVKKEAMKRLVGILGMTSLFGGLAALPLTGLAAMVINAIAGAFGDDDEPFQVEDETRKLMADVFGKDFAELLAKGPINAAAGLDMSSRVSLKDLWFRSPDPSLEGKDFAYHYLEQVAGPVAGIFINMAKGTQQIAEGHTQRGMESMAPKFIKDWMKAARFAEEGATTFRGDPILDEFSGWQLGAQLAGFTPAELARQYDRNKTLKYNEQFVLDRRKTLINDYVKALKNKEGVQDVVSEVRAFNRKWPEKAITMKTIRNSLRARARHSQGAVHGMIVDKALRNRLAETVDY